MKKKVFALLLIVILCLTIAACVDTEVEKNNFVVSFDALCEQNISEQTIDKGALATKPTDPVRDGYTFLGWYELNGSESGDWGNAWNFEEYTINADVTLYARWSKNPEKYSVTFYNENEQYLKQEDIVSGQIITRPQDPAKTDSVFVGWFKGSENGISNTEYDFSLPITENLKLYAVWKDKLFINLNYDGGANTDSVDRIEVADGIAYTLPRPLKSEHTFLGWYNGETKVSERGVFSGAESISLTAKWQAGTSGVVYEKGESFAKVVVSPVEVEEVIIAESYDGMMVKEISIGAFENNDKIKKVIIPEGVVDIGETAFCGSTIEDVLLPSTVKTIGIDAFYECSNLKTIELNEGLENICTRAFRKTALEEIVIPSTVLKIQNGALNECAQLKKVVFTREKVGDSDITLPEEGAQAILRLNSAGMMVFVPNSSVQEYFEAWKNQNQWSITTRAAIISSDKMNDEEIIEGEVLYSYKGTSAEYAPQNITEVYCGALMNNTHVQTVILDDEVKTIGGAAFKGCTNLTKVVLNMEARPTILTNANASKLFDDTNNVELMISGSAFNSFNNAPNYNANTKTKIEYTVTVKNGNEVKETITVGRHCTVSIDTPSPVLGKKFIGYTCENQVFDLSQKITSDIEIVEVWEDVEIYTVNFKVKGETTSQQVNAGDLVSRPQDPTTTSGETFEGWYLSNDDGVTLTEAFDFNTPINGNATVYAKFTTLDITCVISLDYSEATVKNGEDTLSYNVGATYELPRPYKNDAIFDGWYKDNVKQAMTGEVLNADDYTLTARWIAASEGLEYTALTDGTYSVKNGNCTEVNVIIPEYHEGAKVTAIGDNAFESKEIVSVVIPEGVATIGIKAFFSTKLKEVTIPASVTSIGNGAFNRSAELKVVNILRSESITKLGNNAVFRLTNPGIMVFVPVDNYDNYINNNLWKTQQNRWGSGNTWNFADAERIFTVNDIDANGFVIKDNILYGYMGEEQDIVVPEGVTKIADGAFYGANITSIQIPNTVESIGAMAFAECSSLTSIVLPENLNSIGVKVFENSALTSIEFKSAVPATIISVQLWSGSGDTVTTYNSASDVFAGVSGCQIVVPANYKDSYVTTFGNLFN